MAKVNNQDASRFWAERLLRSSPKGLMNKASRKGYYKGGIAFDSAECFTLQLGLKLDGSRSVYGERYFPEVGPR
jgi:hypothetical protein